jgi:regulatory protein
VPRYGAEPPADVRGAAADPERVARAIVLRRLDASPRTRAELAGTLQERGVPPEVALRVLDRFEEAGLIDDRAFARMWVESRQAGRGLAGRALAVELRRRGVPEELIAEALGGIGPEAELAAARQVAGRRARSLAGLPTPTRVRRLTGALARKGYGPSIVSQVVREVIDEGDGQP